MELQIVQQKVFEIRGQKVMFDFDLAALYQVETRVFNQAVKRNIDSFPEEFMFQLTAKEWESLRSQIVISNFQAANGQHISSSRIVISKRGGVRYLPYVFTEHGVTMAAGIIKTPIARKMNIAIVRTFIALRKFALQYHELLEQLKELNERVGNHDVQLNQIYAAIEALMKQKEEQENFKDRERIGFKK